MSLSADELAALLDQADHARRRAGERAAAIAAAAPTYLCDCGRRFPSLAALRACQNGSHA